MRIDLEEQHRKIRESWARMTWWERLKANLGLTVYKPHELVARTPWEDEWEDELEDERDPWDPSNPLVSWVWELWELDPPDNESDQ